MKELHWFWRVTLSLAAAGSLHVLAVRLLVALGPIGAPVGYVYRWSQDWLLDVLHAWDRYECAAIWAHHLIIMVLLAVPIFVLVTNWPIRGGRDAFGCRRCGYNLTGNVSGVCPECGEKIQADEVNKGGPNNGSQA
ncbi:MAG: hypothetical protein QUV05_12925 [Phycisphaerae bacterium]|nr:hypothetical protein [Phycisphaerae bacterium]